MPKLIAPHGASWRGRALSAGDVIDVSEAEAPSLIAHGFQKLEDSTGTADVPSASGLSGNAAADKMSAVPVKSSTPAAAEPDVATLPRKDLLKLLKGRGLGNLFVKPTEELRALAAIVLAGEKLTEADDGRE